MFSQPLSPDVTLPDLMIESAPWLVHNLPGPDPIVAGKGLDQRREGVVDEGLEPDSMSKKLFEIRYTKGKFKSG